MKKQFLGTALIVTLTAAYASGAAAATRWKTLYAFTGGNDGQSPVAPLIADSKGNLYGTTPQGGGGSSCFGSTIGCGTVFELIAPSSPDGTWHEKILHAFTGASGGFEPVGALIFDSAGNLYGTTEGGGDVNNTLCGNPVGGGCGVVFELSPQNSPGGSWTEKVLYTFEGGADGAWPESSLVFDKVGNLYGTTAIDGAGYGTVFELSPGADGIWTESVIYSFTNTGDGYVPEGPLVFDTTGNLYGTTTSGPDPGQGCGLHNGCGTVFQLVPPAGGGAWTGNTLFDFDNSNGADPQGGVLIDPSGNLFGVTMNGGPNGRPVQDGVAFELIPPQSGGLWTEIVLWDFIGGGDAHPYGFVGDASGNLYGTTLGNAPEQGGEVFKLSNAANGWNRTVLHYLSNTRFSQGYGPQAQVVFGKWDALYGTTSEGGNTTCNCGTVFGLLP